MIKMNKKILIFSLIIVFCLISGSSTGFRLINNNGLDISIIYNNTVNTIYVDDDFNSSTLGWQVDHFNKIQDGINKVAIGGEVYVYNGNYNENFVINKQINLIGEDRNKTILIGAEYDIVKVTSSYVNISNFLIKYTGGAVGISGIKLDKVKHCNIINNNITNIYYGLTTKNSNENCIDGNIFYNNTFAIEDTGSFLVETYLSTNNTIINNLIVHNYFGICLTNSENNLIYNNLFNNIIGQIGMENAYALMNNTWNISKTLGTNIIGGPYLGGNYYADYEGIDTNGDGLGDTPYIISEKIGVINKDYLPLTEANDSTKADIYVDDDFNSSTPGWQVDHFNKIQDAIDVAKSNSAIYVYNGLYNGGLIIDKSLSLIGENKNTTIIGNKSSLNDVILIDASHTKIAGFTIIGAPPSIFDFNTGITICNSSCKIMNNIIKDNGFNIYFDLGADNTTIKDNIFYNGIYGRKTCNNMLDSNIFLDNTVWGWCIWLEGCRNSTFTNNKVTMELPIGDLCFGLQISDSKNCTIDNNEITKYYTGIFAINCKNITICNNDFINHTLGVHICEKSKKNEIKYNNFLDCKIDAVCFNSYLNKWHHNYWGRARILPKLIFGFPLMNIDWRPSIKPN